MRKFYQYSLFISLSFGLTASTVASDRDKALALIEQAIKAQGGEEALTKTQSALRNATGVMFLAGKEQPFSSETLLQLPSRLRLTIDLNASGQKTQIIIVVNDDKGWQSVGGAATELGKDRLAELQEEIYAIWLTTLVPLKTDKAFELTVLPDAQIDGQPAAGVKVTRKDHNDVKLYFDKKTSLLVRLERTAREAGAQVQKESLYSEHKQFDGVKLPSKQIEMLNGKKFIDSTLSGNKNVAAPGEGVFAKP